MITAVTDITDIKVGQMWRCVNNDLVKILNHYNNRYGNSKPDQWQFTVSMVESEHDRVVVDDTYDITGEGKFWEGDMSDDDIDVGHNLSQLLSIEEYPEYYL